MTLDVTKPVQTRDGRKARIICTDRAGSDFKFVALILNEGLESVYVADASGRVYTDTECRHDLMNVPEETKGWHLVFQNGATSFTAHKTLADAKVFAVQCPRALGSSVAGYSEVTRIDGEITEIKYHPKESE